MHELLVQFRLDDQATIDQAQELSAELGLSVDELAKSAFEVYLDRTKLDRAADIDEAQDHGVVLLPGTEPLAELEGDEPWLSTGA